MTAAVRELHRSLNDEHEWTIVCLRCLRIHRSGQWTEERASGTGGRSTGFCDECVRVRRMEIRDSLSARSGLDSTGHTGVSWTPSWSQHSAVFAEKRQYIRLRQVTNEVLAKIRYLNQLAITQQRGLLDDDAAAHEFEVTERELHECVDRLRASAGILG
jgi:hypothetical protein